MAHIKYQVTGTGADGKAVREKFPDTPAGREAAKAFAATVDGAQWAYVVRWRVGGQERSRTFTRRKDADAYLTTVEAERLRGVVIDPRRARATVREYGTDWLAKRHNLSEKTVELYTVLLERHIYPTFGDTALGAVTPSSVRTWHAALGKRHQSTAAKSYRLLRQIMNTALADEIITRNPCLVKGAGQETAAERPIAGPAEVQALADAMPERLRVAVLLAAWCQLRRGELLGLRRKDIDPLNGRLTIAATRITTKEHGLFEKEPKTEAGRRTLSVPSNILPALRDHLETYVGPEPDAPVLVGEYGGAVIPGVLQAAWHRARVKIGRPELHLHDLRHSGLTWAAVKGAATRELMRRAGHASPAAALRYQHATEERDQEIAEALASLAPTAEVVRISPRDHRGTKTGATGSRRAR